MSKIIPYIDRYDYCRQYNIKVQVDFTGRIKYRNYSYGTEVQFEVKITEKIAKWKWFIKRTEERTVTEWIDENEIYFIEYPDEEIYTCETISTK